MGLFEILTLYIAFRIKHFVCDFVLQDSWMASIKGQWSAQGNKALFIHAGIHAMGVLVVTLLLAPAFWWLVAVDFVVHAIVDRLKGNLTETKGWTVKDKAFWWAFGLDQEAHNFTHLVYIVIIVVGGYGLI